VQARNPSLDTAHPTTNGARRQLIERKPDWDDPGALKEAVKVLSEVSGATWFLESYNPRYGYWNLWEIMDDSRRKRHTKNLRTGETRAFVELKLALAQTAE
jgi:hypothetical protein